MIRTGSPIIAQDVITAVNANYPEYAGIVPANLFKGMPFIAGDTSTGMYISDYISSGGKSQSLATTLAILSLNLGARSKGNQSSGGSTYMWVGDSIILSETKGSRVAAGRNFNSVSAISTDASSAISMAQAMVSGSPICQLASLYSSGGIQISLSGSGVSGGNFPPPQTFPLSGGSLTGSSTGSVGGLSATVSVSASFVGTSATTTVSVSSNADVITPFTANYGNPPTFNPFSGDSFTVTTTGFNNFCAVFWGLDYFGGGGVSGGASGQAAYNQVGSSSNWLCILQSAF